jgi:hypothetical protein
MGFHVSNVHRQLPDAAGADDRRDLDFVMLDVGWHVGSPSQRKRSNLNPAQA